MPWFLHFEPSLEALTVRSDVISSIEILSRRMPRAAIDILHLEGRCKATEKREFKLPWRAAGPPNHLNATVDFDQSDVNKELSLSLALFFSLMSLDTGPETSVWSWIGVHRNGACLVLNRRFRTQKAFQDPMPVANTYWVLESLEIDARAWTLNQRVRETVDCGPEGEGDCTVSLALCVKSLRSSYTGMYPQTKLKM